MKTLITALLCFSAPLASIAQTTVNSTFIATVGDTVLLSEDTANGGSLFLGSPGGDITWDFTMLVDHQPDGAIFEDPSTAPLSSNFPDADFVINDHEDSSHIFFKQTSTALDVIGFVEYDSLGNPEIPEFNVSQKYMQFPASYLDTFSSSNYVTTQTEFIGVDPDSILPHPTIDSFRSKYYYETFSEIDAWGTMKLPGGDYLSIRQYTWSRARIESDWYGNGQWRPFSESIYLSQLDAVTYDTADEVSYRWWSDNAEANFWICEVEVDSGGVIRDSVSFNNRAPEPPLGTDAIKAFSVEVFPNPTHAFINVQQNGSTSGQYHLLDINGKVVAEGSYDSSDFRVDVSTRSPGIYLLQITDGHGLMSLRRVEIN